MKKSSVKNILKQVFTSQISCLSRCFQPLIVENKNLNFICDSFNQLKRIYQSSAVSVVEISLAFSSVVLGCVAQEASNMILANRINIFLFT